VTTLRSLTPSPPSPPPSTPPDPARPLADVIATYRERRDKASEGRPDYHAPELYELVERLAIANEALLSCLLWSGDGADYAGELGRDLEEIARDVRWRRAQPY
jgi:hypothetical protein